MKSQQSSFHYKKKPSFTMADEDEDYENGETNVKLKGPESPFYNAVSPMIYALRVFGFAPYEFDKDNLVPSTVNLGFTIISTIFYSFIFITFCRNVAFTGDTSKTTILVASERGKVFLNYTLLMAHLISTILHRKKFTHTWNSIADFDECLQKKGYVRSEFGTKVRMWALALFNIVVWFSVNQAGMQAFSERWYQNISYMVLYIASAASLYKFVGMVFSLAQRFRFLNKIAGLNEMAIHKDESNIEKDTKWIEVMFSELMTISEKFIQDNSWCLFFWIFNLGMHSVSNSYFLLEFCSSEDIDIPYYFVWCLSSWLFAYICQMVVLHICCHFTSSEANCMGYILFERRKSLALHGYQENINLQSTLHLLNRKLKFLAAGCFNVNLPLLRSMIGVTTTYLVILLQLPDDKDGIEHKKSS